jgi:SHS family lactate transporter-like MFS transporter
MNLNKPVLAPPQADPRDASNALIASFLGWTLDAFDFFILVFCIPAIAKEFATDIKAVAATIGLTLAFRPVGAFIFGLLADRYGRRLPLMLNLVFFSVVEVLSGLAPNFGTFLVLRALFGIGMGGEWGVGASLAMEKVAPRWRGALSGLLQSGYAAGYLLAACCYFTVFPLWGWRAMFFMGGLPALLALFLRYRVKESAVWEKSRQPTWSSLRVAILGNWKLFMGLTVYMTAMHLVSHGTQDMYPTFLKEQRGFSTRQVAVIAVAYNICAVAGCVFFGFLSDRIGRRRGIIAAFCGAMLVVPLWAYAPSTGLLLLGACLLMFLVQGAFGVIPAHINELSPDSVRGFLPGFAYACGVIPAGYIAYVQALFAEHFGYSTAMAFTAVTVFALGIVANLPGRERRGATFGVDEERANAAIESGIDVN